MYTTSNAADDIEDVRAAMGYGRINLFGVSYGTRMALENARRHPGSVRSVMLAGVNSPADHLPKPQPAAAQEALEGLETVCKADPACNRAFPAFAAEFDQVMAGLDKAPVSVNILDPATGDVKQVRLSRALAAEAVRYMMYSPATSGDVPAIIQEAARGNFTPLAKVGASASSAALAGARLLAGQLFGVAAGDPVSFAVVAGVVGAVALVASIVPARRAAALDPLQVLREE